METIKLNQIEAKDQLKEAEATEIIDTGKKKFNFMGKECFIIHPTVKQEVELKNTYAKMFSEFLTKGDFLCRHQMEKVIKDRGLWTEEDRAEAQELFERIKLMAKFYSLPVSKMMIRLLEIGYIRNLGGDVE